MSVGAGREPPTHGVAFGAACKVWLRIAALSFGGPAGQIAVMHRIVVDEKRWIGEERFLHALSYCTLLPGPEAQQLAIYIGWLMHRTRGGIVAGTLFVLPGLLSIMALSVLYAGWGKVGVVAGFFFGLKAAVLAVVLQAVLRVGSRALKNRARLTVAAAAFLAIFALGVPFPLIILAAALAGLAATLTGSRAFVAARIPGPAGEAAVSLLDGAPERQARPRVRDSLGVAALWLALWLTPVAAVLASEGPGQAFAAIAIFFSKMAVVTFGGAYAVLAYVAQQAVETYHWLQPGEMLDGLGLAETTPGPLIMVTQFVGFMAAYRHPGSLSPMLAGILGGLLTTWVTFTPCFLWIFLGAPYVEALRGNSALEGALSAITAAVVGVILNLALWFALHTWFKQAQRIPFLGPGFDVPVLTSLDLWALALSLAALVAVFQFKAGMISTLLACAGAGVVLDLAGALPNP